MKLPSRFNPDWLPYEIEEPPSDTSCLSTDVTVTENPTVSTLLDSRGRPIAAAKARRTVPLGFQRGQR